MFLKEKDVVGQVEEERLPTQYYAFMFKDFEMISGDQIVFKS